MPPWPMPEMSRHGPAVVLLRESFSTGTLQHGCPCYFLRVRMWQAVGMRTARMCVDVPLGPV